MQINKGSKLYGLSSTEQHLLTALYEAYAASRPVPAWVAAREHATSRARLLAAGLISERLRLTLQGLVIAVNLPARCRSSLGVAA